VVMIEWGNKVPGVLPEEYLEIRFDVLDDQSRRFTAIPHGPRYEGRIWFK
jgi:tRNA A37 threonylcarbamoyladenosine biosynthesis protein TsaE